MKDAASRLTEQMNDGAADPPETPKKAKKAPEKKAFPTVFSIRSLPMSCV